MDPELAGVGPQNLGQCLACFPTGQTVDWTGVSTCLDQKKLKRCTVILA
ncbi:hypothetical protein [Mameliella sp. MMSF_3455]|nr:hypothetical protein [Mameliella sp. MMSF_3455]